MGRQRPGSVTNAVRVLVGLVVLTGLTAVLTVVLRGDLVASWASGHPHSTGSVRPPDFVPVAVVLFFVFAALAGVLVMFFLGGHNWARLSLSALVVFLGVGALAGLRAGPPPLFMGLAGVAVLLGVVLLGCLWHPGTSAYLRRAARPEAPGSRPAS